MYEVGSTSRSVDLQICDDTGMGVAGLVAATFPPMVYSLAGPNADVAFPALSDLATVGTAWTAGGIKERTNGWYRVDLPNGVFSAAGVVTVRGDATGKHVVLDPLNITPIAGNVAAIKAKTDNLPAQPAAVGSQMDLVDAPNATALGAMVTAIFSGGSIDGYTLLQFLRLIGASMIGKVSGLPGTAIAVRAANDSKTRLSFTLDANGNITAVTADAT